MSYGHTAEQAEAVAAQIPAWAKAPARGLEVFAAANAKLWAEIARDNPADWPVSMAAAARAWHTHRLNRR